MKVIKINVQEEWEQNYKKEELTDRIIKEILTICKFDENFNINDNTNQIEDKIKNIQKKIKSKDELLIKSNEMMKLLTSKISELENENFRIKSILLETLGSFD